MPVLIVCTWPLPPFSVSPRRDLLSVHARDAALYSLARPQPVNFALEAQSGAADSQHDSPSSTSSRLSPRGISSPAARAAAHQRSAILLCRDPARATSAVRHHVLTNRGKHGAHDVVTLQEGQATGQRRLRQNVEVRRNTAAASKAGEGAANRVPLWYWRRC